jgi:hypothetical protein
VKAAKLESSPRLQRVHALLSDGRPRTTRDIVTGAHVCAVNSCIAELRENGVPVQCERKGDLWWYWIETTCSPASPAG